MRDCQSSFCIGLAVHPWVWIKTWNCVCIRGNGGKSGAGASWCDRMQGDGLCLDLRIPISVLSLLTRFALWHSIFEIQVRGTMLEIALMGHDAVWHKSWEKGIFVFLYLYSLASFCLFTIEFSFSECVIFWKTVHYSPQVTEMVMG